MKKTRVPRFRGSVWRKSPIRSLKISCHVSGGKINRVSLVAQHPRQPKSPEIPLFHVFPSSAGGARTVLNFLTLGSAQTSPAWSLFHFSLVSVFFVFRWVAVMILTRQLTFQESGGVSKGGGNDQGFCCWLPGDLRAAGLTLGQDVAGGWSCGVGRHKRERHWRVFFTGLSLSHGKSSLVGVHLRETEVSRGIGQHPCAPRGRRIPLLVAALMRTRRIVC